MTDNWKIFAQRTAVIEKRFIPAIERVVIKHRQAFIKDLKTHGKDTAIANLQRAGIDAKMATVLQSIYKVSGLMGAKMTFEEVKKAAAQKATGFGRNETWIRDVLNFLKTNLIEMVQNILESYYFATLAYHKSFVLWCC